MGVFGLFITAFAWAGPTVEPSFDARLAITGWRPGAELVARPGMKIGLWNNPESALFNDTYARFEADIQGSQTALKMGARTTFAPIAWFDLSLHGGWQHDFATFDSAVSFDSADATYGEFEEMLDQPSQAASKGWYFGGATTLKGRLGPTLFLLGAELTHWGIDSAPAGDWLFDRGNELLLHKQNENVLHGNAAWLFPFGFGSVNLRLGVAGTYRRALASEDQLLRAGLMFSLGHGGQRWNHHLIAQAYLIDRAYAQPFPPYLAYQIRFTLN